MLNIQTIDSSEIIAGLSLIVAMLSLLINIVPLWRDRARVDFSLYLAELGSFHQNKFVKESDNYAFRIVNSGRRPITITSVGGITSDISIWRYWLWRLTGLPAPRMFLINDPGLATLLKDKQGNDRTLNEGEYSFGSVLIDLSTLSSKGLKARQFHVIDSLGRYHRLPWKAHRKLTKSVESLRTGDTSKKSQ